MNGASTEFSPHLKGNIDLTVMTARLLAAKQSYNKTTREVVEIFIKVSGDTDRVSAYLQHEKERNELDKDKKKTGGKKPVIEQ